MPHEPKVRLWLKRALVSPDDIDDLIQEAYCRLSSLETVDHIDRPDGYFFQIVRNLLTEQLRRARIIRFEAASELETQEFACDEPSPEQTTAARRELARISRLIEALPDRCRKVFRLRKIDGVPQREIARMLGISEASVENEGVKGLKLIMQALREDAEQPHLALKKQNARTRNRTGSCGSGGPLGRAARP
ncbi:MAG: sigma-70 family RNA polymerase sigma factor [Caulobacter sp.]